MAVVALALVAALGHVPSLASLKGQLVELVIAGGAGLAVYVGAASAMGVDEMRIARTTIVNRLLPSR
jgi:hypothetical protein